MTDRRVDDWELVESEQLADYRITRVRRDRRRSPRTGAEHDFIVLQMPEWVNVIAVTRQARIVVIEQYRHGTQEVAIEIPGGVVDPADDEPAQAARRELLEETGYTAQEFVCIGKVTANPAIQDNRCHTFVALGAHAVGEAQLEAGEDIAVSEVGMDEVTGLIASGRMSHALVIAGFWWFDQWRGEHADLLHSYLDVRRSDS
jgi:8-oxo-dGTP pyrophosphatase MutT (NUDIX family)